MSAQVSRDSVNIKIDRMMLRVLGIMVAIGLVPGVVQFGWDGFLTLLGAPWISYFGACALVSLVAFVVVVVVGTIVIVKELI